MKMSLVHRLFYMISAVAGAVFLISCPGPNPAGPVSGSGLDVFILNENANGVYTNDGGGTFSQAKAAADSNQSTDAVFHDFDSDGDLDAFVVTYGGINKLYLNNGGGSFIITDVSSRTSDGTAAVLGDFNGDGMEDVFVANELEENIIYLGTGGGVFAERTASPGTEKSWGVDAGDLDGDGDTDILVANAYQDKSKVYINDGSGSFTVSDLYSQSYVTTDVELGDLDNDGDLDAFMTNDGHENLIFWNDGGANFTKSNADPTVRNSSGASLGDLDGDGDIDAFVANTFDESDVQNQKNQVYINLGEKAFSSQAAGNKTLLGSDVELADLDADGDLDAVVANYGDVNVIYMNDGSANFSPSTAPGPQTDSFNAVAADFTAP